MLNWRRDPDFERRMNAKLIEIERIKTECEQIKKDTERIKNDTERIKSETEQLRRENARLRALNAKAKILLSCVDQHCFPPESSSSPVTPTESDSRSF
jgi:hypothetical protein